MTLEEQLSALLAEHDLTSIGVNVSRRHDGSNDFHAYAHGDVRGLAECAGGAHANTAGGAIANAIALLVAKRGAPAVDLAPMGEPA